MNLWEKLERCKGLEKGWDSYKADPPNDLSIENARKFLVLCHDVFPPYRLCPTVVGGVGMIWRNEEKEVCMEFYNSGKIWYIAYDDKSNIDDSVVKEVTDYETGLKEIMGYFE